MFKKPIEASSGLLRVGLQNIRSMRNKLIYVVEALRELNLDLFCLTETWSSHSDTGVISAALPESYSFFLVPRPSGVGGGVTLIHSLTISNIRQMPNNFELSSFEYLEICFLWHRQPFRLVVVYRPGHPGTDRDFMDEFGSLLEGLMARDEKIVICGDFNYWIDDPNLKPYSLEFVELLDLNNIVNHVSSPTHVHGHTLDLVLTPQTADLVSSLEVMPIDCTTSDHALIHFCLNVAKPSSYTKSIVFHRYHNLNCDDLIHEIQQNLRVDVATSQTGDQLVAYYNGFFHNLCNTFCPVTSKVIIVREDGPWFNHTIVTLRKQRRRAERKWRRLRTDSSRSDYVLARRTVERQIFHCKAEYFKHQLDTCKGDQRRIYLLLNTLVGQQVVSKLPKVISEAKLANDFMDFFTSKIVRIRGEIEDTPVVADFSVQFSSTLPAVSVFSQFQPVQESDVLRYIRESNKTYCPLDPINVSKLGSSYEKATPFVTVIINTFFREGHFVTSESKGLIRPYLKKPGLDTEDLKNYRPVSNLSYLSKIVERAMLDQLLPFLEQSEIISRYQSAYRKFHSTETALCKIHDDLVINVCSGKTSLLVLLDMSAAFDTIDHQLLLSDLASHGVQDTAFRLLESYTTHRTQRVIVGESESGSTPLLFGVPQGSVLGPILFVVYTSTLVLLLEAHGVGYHFYADDTQLYIHIDDIQDCKEKLVLLLDDIGKWMTERKLKLNNSKTEIAIIKGNLRSDKEEDFGVLNLGDAELIPVESVKNLGVIFDSTLSFRNHINSVVKICNYHIRNLYSIRKFVNRESILTLVQSLIVSKVDYCNSLFLGLPGKTLSRLQSVLNRAARLAFQLPPRVPTTSYLIDLHWLPVRARIEFKICLITFKVLKFRQPQYLLGLLTPLTVTAGVRLRSTDDPFRLIEPRAVRERGFADRSFSYAAPRLYNQLPVAIKQLNSVDNFKKQLKTHLFSRAYDLATRTTNREYRT